MSDKWPTLEGRLNQPLTSTKDALLQMEANGDELSPLAKKMLGGFKEIKPFQKQFCECSELGLNKETVFVSFDTNPEFMPAFPTPDMKKDIKSGEWKGINFLKCGKFNNGKCSSGNTECKKLRGWKD